MFRFLVVLTAFLVTAAVTASAMSNSYGDTTPPPAVSVPENSTPKTPNKYNAPWAIRVDVVDSDGDLVRTLTYSKQYFDDKAACLKHIITEEFAIELLKGGVLAAKHVGPGAEMKNARCEELTPPGQKI
jgi:hypothetical protein